MSRAGPPHAANGPEPHRAEGFPVSRGGAADDARPPLAGLRVIDCSRVLAGPYCGALLADLGAEVIRLEHPTEKDEVRTWAPFVDGVSASYVAMNRGKRGIALDIGHPEGGTLFAELLATADVLVENFRPGMLDRHGFTRERIAAISPRLVHCSIRAFPSATPMAQQPGYEASMQAITGIMSVTGEAGGDPVRCGPSVTDLGTGLASTIAVLAALRERDRSGRGQWVEPSLMRTATALLGVQVASTSASGTPPQRQGSGHPALVPYRIFPCRDGPLFIAGGNDRLWARLCAVLKLAGEDGALPFPTLADRVAHRADTEARVATATAGWARADLLRALDAEGVPAAPVNRVDEFLAEPSLRGAAVVREFAADGARGVTVPGLLFAGLAAVDVGPAPGVGEHTDDILRALGVPAERIARLRQAGAIA